MSPLSDLVKVSNLQTTIWTGDAEKQTATSTSNQVLSPHALLASDKPFHSKGACRSPYPPVPSPLGGEINTSML